VEQTQPAGTSDAPERPNLFVRQATGLVRGVPSKSSIVINFIPGHPTQTLAAVFFFALTLAPGGNVFLGILLWGRDRVAPALYLTSAVAVWLGSWLSGFFVIATDAWMQHPVGYVIASDGRIQLQSLAAVLLSPFAWWQFAHAITGAVLTGSFIVAGIGAYYLLAKRDVGFGREFVRTGVIVALVASALAVFPTGDRNGAAIGGEDRFPSWHTKRPTITLLFAVVGIDGQAQTQSIFHQLGDPREERRVEVAGEPLGCTMEAQSQVWVGIGLANEEPGVGRGCCEHLRREAA